MKPIDLTKLSDTELRAVISHEQAHADAAKRRAKKLAKAAKRAKRVAKDARRRADNARRYQAQNWIAEFDRFQALYRVEHEQARIRLNALFDTPDPFHLRRKTVDGGDAKLWNAACDYVVNSIVRKYDV